MAELTQNDRSPVYNIKAAACLLGVLPVTLRAWERRYGLPNPQRGQQGYRLYSEYDLNTLRWVKMQVDLGLSISRAVEHLADLKAQNRDPARQITPFQVELPQTLPLIAARLREALLSYDEPAASEILSRGFALYSIDQVLVQVVQKVLVDLGEAWHAHELEIAREHFSTQFFLQHLMGMLATASMPYHPGVIAAACAPGETHQIGMLIVVVMLRWRGWDVKYFGPDLSLEKLGKALLPLSPRLLLFSATRQQNAKNLLAVEDLLAEISGNKPLVVLGGQAFKTYRLPTEMPLQYLDDAPMSMVERIEELMEESNPNIRKKTHSHE
jgi:DNA-binding transcriptional MerR regulator